ncbi:MAG: leucyl aminopeptidase [Candidatus Norongarragalinales archaeon]
MALEFTVAAGKLEEQSTECIVASAFEGKLSHEAEKIDKALNGEISSALKRKEFEGKSGSLMVLRTLGKLKARKVVVIGLGKEKDYSKQTAQSAAALAFQAVKNDCESIAFKASRSDAVAIVETAILCSYDFQEWKTVDKKEIKARKILFVFESKDEARKAEPAIEQARVIANAQNYCRELNNANPATATPAFIASEASKLSGGKISVEVLGMEELKKKGYNAIVSVGKGSVNEPKLIVIKYNGGKQGDKPYAIVGKGVCFDTGGLDLKPGKYMSFMQYDKSGACAAIAIIKAVKELSLPINLVAITPMVENMPSGAAYKPGDLVKTASGKTIEITNTDAEGRVILSDALHHAASLKPKAIIDLATLTGACVIALGKHAAGLMTNNAQLAEKIKKAADESGERVWELPMWKEYEELVKSEIADVHNADASPDAGTIEGGWFLRNFVPDEIPWVHLDIAGTAWVENPNPIFRAGSTGWGVRLLVEFLKKECAGGNR